eukprot:6463012-Alexandrium_andersonii.AAC.1
MSASLVGSEMCIRDSQRAMRKLRTWRVRGARGNSAGPGAPASTHTASAVSYTHLTLPTICSV